MPIDWHYMTDRLQQFELTSLFVFYWRNKVTNISGSRGLMDRVLDLKPEVTQGCGFKSRLRQEVHDRSPGAAQSAAHCSKCVHLDGLNAENTFHSSLYSV